MKQLTPEDVVARYAAGESLRVIADAAEVSYSTVRRVLVANGVGLRGPGRYGGVTVEGSRRNVQRMADQARDLQPIVPGRRPGRLANGSRRDAAPRPRVRPAEPGGWALVDSLESLCADLRPRRPTAPRPPSWTTTTSK